MPMTTPLHHRRSNSEAVMAGFFSPYFEGGCCATANTGWAPNSKAKMLIGSSKRRLAGYGPNIPIGPKLYRALWTPEDR